MDADDKWIVRIRAMMLRCRGLFHDDLTRDAIYAVRDPHGLRPSIGKLPEGSVIASETCALSTIGAEYVDY